MPLTIFLFNRPAIVVFVNITETLYMVFELNEREKIRKKRTTTSLRYVVQLATYG